MDIHKKIDEASAECQRLAAVAGGEISFNPGDYVKFRELAADLKRQDDADLALFGRKMDEVYRGVVKLDALRERYPEHARPVRKAKEAVIKAIQSLERVGDRIAADVYRKAGGQCGKEHRDSV